MMKNYLEDLFGLTAKTAVVIGGTGELCGAMAEGLARAGAEVIIVGRNKEKAATRISVIKKAGGHARFLEADVSTKSALSALKDRILKEVNQIDILINGAGINSPTPFFEVEEEEIDQILNLNFKAIYLGCQIFGKHMLSKGSGSIINLGSISGMNPLSKVFTYSASKAAVHNLTKNLAREWAEKGVRVNTLVPGFFPAEQNRKVLTEDRVAQIMGHTPIKRFGESRELIGATLLLASENAGSFITGHEMVVDGGFNAMTI
ncbi:MAG: SDR family oxidoreductase [Opitutales bacterium]|nr:SDR family oxidoreductase [Opitutales bacterium]